MNFRASFMNERTLQFVEELNKTLIPNLNRIEFQFNNEYGWPEFDPLRDEISKCLICDFCQAAITLTNHLLENFLKTICIYSDSIENRESAPSNGLTINKLSTDKFDGLDLCQTLRYAKKVGLISKVQWKQLDNYRDEFRNAYSHAEKKKIFKDKTVVTLEPKIEDGQFTLGSSSLIQLLDIPAYQGIFQAIMSKNVAFDYFISVDELIRSILDNFKLNSKPQDGK